MNRIRKAIGKWSKRLAKQSANSFSLFHSKLTKEQLRLLLGDIFGYYALLYSSRAKELVGKNVVVKNSIVISEDSAESQLICQYQELPIASDCIDLVVLPETLQQCDFPHQILREVERVLIPEGHIILIMENPMSWLSLKRRILVALIGKNRKGHLIGRLRIADWFRLLGFETVNEVPISPADNYLQKSQYPFWIKKTSQVICSYLSGYYIIVAKKKVSRLTPIRPSWRSNQKLVSPRFAEPSVNSQVDDYLKQLK